MSRRDLNSHLLMRPLQAPAEARARNDVKGETHRVFCDLMHGLLTVPVGANPAGEHGLGLTYGFLEDEEVVLLSEGRRGDFAVMAPDAAFRTYYPD